MHADEDLSQPDAPSTTEPADDAQPVAPVAPADDVAPPVMPPSAPPQAAWTQAPVQQVASANPFDRLIPARNAPALIGYYLGVFSLVPCFTPLLGPAAIVCGIYGLKAVARQPELPGKGHAITAIVLGGLMTLICLVVLGLALVLGQRS